MPRDHTAESIKRLGGGPTAHLVNCFEKAIRDLLEIAPQLCSRPIGAPNSDARKKQEFEEEIIRRARGLLSQAEAFK